MAPATSCIAGVPVSDFSTSQAKYAATRTATSPEMGTIQSRGVASNRGPPPNVEKSARDKNQAPAPTEGAAALWGKFTESGAKGQTAVSFDVCPHRKHR